MRHFRILLLQFIIVLVLGNRERSKKPEVHYRRFTGNPDIARLLMTLYSRRMKTASTTRPHRTLINNHSSSYSILKTSISSPIPKIKKWHVGRFSRKQFEIVNMLWRKTNVFVDVGSASPAPGKQTSNDKTRPEPITTLRYFEKLSLRELRASTVSYMEFYYLDETVDDGKPKNFKSNKGNKGKNKKSFPIYNTRSATQLTHSTPKKEKSTLNLNPTSTKNLNIMVDYFNLQNRILSDSKDKKTLPYDLFNDATLDSPSTIRFTTKKKLFYATSSNTVARLTSHRTHSSHHGKTLSNVRLNMLPTRYYNKTQEKISDLISKLKNSSTMYEDNVLKGFVNESSTQYDKIKFFEIYDSFTLNPRAKIYSDSDQYDSNGELSINSVDNNDKDHKLSLEDVDRDMKEIDVKSKHIKKHITDFQGQDVQNSTQDSNLLNSDHHIDSADKLKTDTFSRIVKNYSTLAKWSDYPYVAVYVYERYQVHCDAAALSPHWLVAAGACLSRHNEDPNVENRSAFVTYCSENWWNPERIAYVKYSIIHPKFNPKDKAQRHLYNVGVIQVVSSMATACNNWRPILIMSHQFMTEPIYGGAVEVVGWGLDRYRPVQSMPDSLFVVPRSVIGAEKTVIGTNVDRGYDMRYSSTLGRKPLTLYEGVVYSDSCPGNSVYRSIKEMSNTDLKNIYCLSLPVYFGEDKDPIHGGLLLVGGQLIALYLQEERRQWGEQSAQYTGVWSLAPWLNKVTIEPEEIDYTI